MDLDEPGWPLIDDFFATESAGRATTTARRYSRVRVSLHHFLDVADMTLGLGSQPATLLEAERQFHEQGAFWTLLGPDELVCCLPSFLHETWLPGSAMDARVQISLVGRLLTHLRRERLIDMSVVGCAYGEAEAAVRQARRDLAARQDDVPRHSSGMPARFLQEPGPEW